MIKTASDFNSQLPCHIKGYHGKGKMSIENPEGIDNIVSLENDIESRQICSMNENQLDQLIELGKKI